MTHNDIVLKKHHSHRWKDIQRFQRIEIVYPDTVGSRNIAWLAIAAIASVFSAGVAAYSAYSQGQAQANMAEYNALIARQNADLALQKEELQKIQTRITEKKQREQTQRLLATQRSLYGKAGVTFEGTPLLVMSETAAEGEIDALAIRYAGSIEEANIIAEQSAYRQDARLARMRGSAAKLAGNIGAGTALLTGLSQFAKYKAG
jgi:hypothetical protein